MAATWRGGQQRAARAARRGVVADAISFAHDAERT